jgi:hypothetical protein
MDRRGAIARFALWGSMLATGTGLVWKPSTVLRGRWLAKNSAVQSVISRSIATRLSTVSIAPELAHAIAAGAPELRRTAADLLSRTAWESSAGRLSWLAEDAGVPSGVAIRRYLPSNPAGNGEAHPGEIAAYVAPFALVGGPREPSWTLLAGLPWRAFTRAGLASCTDPGDAGHALSAWVALDLQFDEAWSRACTAVIDHLSLQRPLGSAAAERMPSLAASMLGFGPRRIAADTPSGQNRRISLPAKAPLALATNLRGAVVLSATPPGTGTCWGMHVLTALFKAAMLDHRRGERMSQSWLPKTRILTIRFFEWTRSFGGQPLGSPPGVGDPIQREVHFVGHALELLSCAAACQVRIAEFDAITQFIDERVDEWVSVRDMLSVAALCHLVMGLRAWRPLELERALR